MIIRRKTLTSQTTIWIRRGKVVPGFGWFGTKVKRLNKTRYCMTMLQAAGKNI